MHGNRRRKAGHKEPADIQAAAGIQAAADTEVVADTEAVADIEAVPAGVLRNFRMKYRKHCRQEYLRRIWDKSSYTLLK